MYFAGMVLTADDLYAEGTYTPAFTATGTDPVVGADGFANGKWSRQGHRVEVIVDINLEGSGIDLGGTSWRVGLPFPADMNFHTAGVLDAESDIIGHFQTRSGTSTQTAAGSVLLATTSEIPDQSMVFYISGTNTSLGAGNFTTEGRLKIYASYHADPASL